MILESTNFTGAASGGVLQKVLWKISQNSQKNTFARVCFLIKLQVFFKETLAQVFSFEFCEVLKNTFFTEYL